MKLIKQLMRHVSRMVGIARLHGPNAVLAFYVGVIPPLRMLGNVLGYKFLAKANVLGNIMYLDVRDGGLHRRLLLSGIREPEHTNQLRREIKPGMTGIELGANVGYFALIVAKLVGPEGKIYCIEPAPANLQLLMKNLSANGYEERTEVFQYLIGDHDGVEKLYLSEWANVHSLSASRGGRGSVDVPMITLDSFLKENEIDPTTIDFLRMDIEGYEVMAFQGMKTLLESSHPFKLFIEFHPGYYQEWGWTFERFLRFLYGHGLRIREIAKHREFDKRGKPRPVILRDPTLEEVLASPVFNEHEGSQAFLERV